MDRLSLLNAVRLGTLVAQEGQGEVDALDLAECWETIPWELWSSRRRDDGYAEVDRRDAGQALGLLAFLPEEGEGEVDALDLTEQCLMFGAGAAGQQVVLDLVEPGKHFWVYGEHGASQTRLTEMILKHVESSLDAVL